MVERGELERRRSEFPGLNRVPLFESPDPALNRAFAWAVRRHPAGVRADPGGPRAWDRDHFDELREEATMLRRVGPAAGRDPVHLLHRVVAGLFGVRADAEGGRFELAPWIPEGWRSMALRRLRCHRTLLDVEVRVRADWVVVRLEHLFGPAIPLAVSVRNVGRVAQVMVDEVPLEGERVVLTLQQLHEVMFFLQGGP
jgi:hypothetical protein